jgi:Flp pilus assembly protein TadD
MPQDAQVIVKLTRCQELNTTGAKLFAEGQLEPARLHFLAALALEPDDPQVLQNLGATLRNLRHYAASEVVAKRAVKVSGGNIFCRSNYGASLLSMRKYKESVKVLAEVAAEAPDSAPILHNYGLALYMNNKRHEALEAFEQAIAQGNPGPHVLSDRALALLSLGRIQEGLNLYECRWDILKKSPLWDFNIPEWKGESLENKRILLHHEQGFGDSLMLCRFVNDVHARGGIVTLAVPNELTRLFKFNFGLMIDVRSMYDEKLAEEKFDYHSPLLATMLHLGYAEPQDICTSAYLVADVGLPVLDRLPKTKYKIGICWASGDHGPSLTDRRRVTQVVEYLRLLNLDGVSVISLQKGPGVAELQQHGLEGLIKDFNPYIEDFADTAAVVSQLDYVISVDSAVAHLAGALGVPCAMLGPYTHCWRWWHEKDGWPWYNGMTIFTQAADGSWTDAIDDAISFVAKKLHID